MLRLLKPTAVRSSTRFIRFYSSDSISKVTPSPKKEPLSPLGKHLHDSIKVITIELLFRSLF